MMTRGMDPKELSCSKLWFEGLFWLSNFEDFWPNFTIKLIPTNDLSELRERSNIFISTIPANNLLSLIDRFSRLSKLTQITAYVLRFKNNILRMKQKLPRFCGPLTVDELSFGLIQLVNVVQFQTFTDDYTFLYKNNKLNNNSKLLKLNPFFDHDNKVNRVGGRI